MGHSIDREKVIKGLRCIIDGTVRCESCGYSIDKHGHHSCQQECAKDAIALLKEQEPALPTWSQGKAYCGNCGQRLPRKSVDREINYCGYCGQAVKWE